MITGKRGRHWHPRLVYLYNVSWYGTTRHKWYQQFLPPTIGKRHGEYLSEGYNNE